MGNPVSIKEEVEGLVGNILKVFGTDTVNNVAQGAAVWLRAVKDTLKYLDPATNVFVEGLAAATGGATLSNASATTKMVGLIARNNDANQRFVRASATAARWLETNNEFVHFAIATRSAANSPAYAFLAWPGGFDVAGNSGVSPATAGAFSAVFNVTTTTTGSTAATDATLYAVYYN